MSGLLKAVGEPIAPPPMAEKRHVVSALHCLTCGVANKKCHRNSAVHIIKSGPYARIKAKAAVCTLQVRPPNRSPGSPLSSPTKPTEHNPELTSQRAQLSSAFHRHAPQHALMRSAPISHTETALQKRAGRLVLRWFQPFDSWTKPDESPVEMNWGPPVEAVGRPIYGRCRTAAANTAVGCD